MRLFFQLSRFKNKYDCYAIILDAYSDSLFIEMIDGVTRDDPAHARKLFRIAQNFNSILLASCVKSVIVVCNKAYS